MLMKNNEPSLLQFTIHYPSVTFAAFGNQEHGAMSQGNEFRQLLYGDKGMLSPLKDLSATDYGHDMEHIAFDFHINPCDYEINEIRAVGTYRKKGHSIDVAVIVGEDFFRKSHEERRQWIREQILERIRQVGQVVSHQKLDTDIERLLADIGFRL